MARWIDWPLVETRKAWREWLQMQEERDRPPGCEFEHPMTFCQACGTWIHCNADGEYKRRPDDA